MESSDKKMLKKILGKLLSKVKGGQKGGDTYTGIVTEVEEFSDKYFWSMKIQYKKDGLDAYLEYSEDEPFARFSVGDNVTFDYTKGRLYAENVKKI